MEKLGEILAVWLYKSRRKLKSLWLKHGSLTANKLSILLIVLFGIMPLTFYFLLSNIEYSQTQIISTYLFVILLFALTLLITITWFKSEELFKSDNHGFSFIQLTQSKINATFFGFTDVDINNLMRLVNGLSPDEKIIIRETPKNKQSGSIRFLFTFLDLIISGGISKIDFETKELLNRLILERFCFQNSEINPGTLPSSYSKWCSATGEGSYENVRKGISKALGIV
jgi:hypothetical protein